MASHGREIRHIAFACGTSFVGCIGRRWIYGESSCVSVRQFTHRPIRENGLIQVNSRLGVTTIHTLSLPQRGRVVEADLNCSESGRVDPARAPTVSP